MPTFTLGDIQQRVWSKLDNNTVLYPASVINPEINDAIQSVQLYAPFSFSSAFVVGDGVAAKPVYAVPPGILYPTRVAWDGLLLVPVPFLDLIRRWRAWSTDLTGGKRGVQRWSGIDMQTFVVHPSPGVGGSGIEVTGPDDLSLTPLVDAGDIITCQDETIELIESLAFVSLVFLEGPKFFADAAPVYQKFLSAMKSRKRFDTMRNPSFYLPNTEEAPIQ